MYVRKLKNLRRFDKIASFFACFNNGALNGKNKNFHIHECFSLSNMQPNLSFSFAVSLFLTCTLPVFCDQNNCLIPCVETRLDALSRLTFQTESQE